MTSIRLLKLREALRALAFVSALATTAAFAGSPLICHPYAVGNAKTLPDSEGDWKGVNPAYDRRNLERDTIAALTPETPIIVRMETLRRAVIYATGGLRQWDKGSYTADERTVAANLITKLRARTDKAKGQALALALFDLGFIAETFRQANLAQDIEGYNLMSRAAELRGPDPEIEFALALASFRPVRPEHAQHLARAKAGSKPGTLLASNLASHFGKS